MYKQSPELAAAIHSSLTSIEFSRHLLFGAVEGAQSASLMKLEATLWGFFASLVCLLLAELSSSFLLSCRARPASA